jgi:uncharacterized membrane protein YdjX (TVP38/TMEM64 family)
MWKWVAIIFVVFTVAGSFQKSGNPVVSGVADLAILITVLLAYRSWRKNKKTIGESK